MKPFKFLSRKIAAARSNFAYWLFVKAHSDHEERVFAELPPMEGDLPPGRGDVVIFCGADKGYVLRFALPFATSVAAASQTAAVHLHLFGTPDEQTRQTFDAIAAVLGPARFTTTFENCDVSRLTRRRQIMYFQSVRFARMLQIAERVNLPFLSMDIDVLFLQPVSKLTEICAGSDIAITLRPREFNPAKKVRAAVFYVGASASARAFLKRAVLRMLVGLFHGPEDEYPDQRALAETIAASTGLNLRPLPAEVLSSESEDAIVFSGRGEVKDHILPGVYSRRFAVPPREKAS